MYWEPLVLLPNQAQNNATFVVHQKLQSYVARMDLHPRYLLSWYRMQEPKLVPICRSV